MDSRSQFLAQFKSVVVPVLRDEGFHGSGQNFRRRVKEVIHVVNVQGSRYGGRCCINLGVHLTFLPTVTLALPDPAKITEPDCEFRTRLSEADGFDRWWPYGESEQDAEDSVTSIKQTYLKFGREFFARFLVFPGDFTKITPENFDKKSSREYLPGQTVVRTLLALARINAHLGNRSYASQFATIGIANLGLASFLKNEFEKLIVSEIE